MFPSIKKPASRKLSNVSTKSVEAAPTERLSGEQAQRIKDHINQLVKEIQLVKEDIRFVCEEVKRIRLEMLQCDSWIYLYRTKIIHKTGTLKEQQSEPYNQELVAQIQMGLEYTRTAMEDVQKQKETLRALLLTQEMLLDHLLKQQKALMEEQLSLRNRFAVWKRTQRAVL